MNINTAISSAKFRFPHKPKSTKQLDITVLDKNQIVTDVPIQISRWADPTGEGLLRIQSGKLPIQMCNSDGTGRPLLKEGTFGADLIHFGPNEGVGNHTHEGSHILFTVKGAGFVEYNGVDHPLEPGVCYLIPSMVDHAIKATTELVLLVVGNDHRDLASPSRLDVVEKAAG